MDGLFHRSVISWHYLLKYFVVICIILKCIGNCDAYFYSEKANEFDEDRNCFCEVKIKNKKFTMLMRFIFISLFINLNLVISKYVCDLQRNKTLKFHYVIALILFQSLNNIILLFVLLTYILLVERFYRWMQL